MQYIHANITNPYTAENAIWGRKLLCISERLHISAKTKIIPVFHCRFVPFTAFCSPDLQTHPLRPGFILFFISRFHLQYAEWINKTHKHVSVWFDGAWRRTQRGTDQDLGPRCNSNPFHCGDQRQSAVRQHLRAQQDRATLLCPPRATIGTLYEIFTDYWRERLNESKHEWSDTWRTTEKEKEKQPEAFVHRLFSPECWHWLIEDVRPAVHFLSLSLTPFYGQFTEVWGSFETVGVSWWVGGA